MAGAGYKLFNTGDVLTAAQVNTYLMEQTVMVFADAAARTAALSGVVSEGMISYLKDTNAVEVYNGSAWVASDDPNAIQNTIVDAKGDLITATAADTPARLAVGNNGETIVADSSTSTGLRYNPQNALANPVINGGFDIAQRGTSIAVASGGSGTYTLDRWLGYRGATGSTISRQTTGDTTNLPNIQYCARIERDSGNTSTQILYLRQAVETTNTIPFVGKTVTLSFYARSGANFSAASSNFTATVGTGTGTDQGPIGFTGETTPLNKTDFVATTTWQRFAITGTISTSATEMYIGFAYTPVGTAGAADFLEVTGVQIDLGTYTASSAPTFRRSGGTLAGELQAAQRYYQRFNTDTDGHSGFFGNAYSTTAAAPTRGGLVQMRTAPTSIDYANVQLYDYVNFAAITGLAIWSATESHTFALLATGATGLTQYRPYALVGNNSAAGYIGLSAEL